MNKIGKNLCFLLWQNNVPRNRWAEIIATFVGPDISISQARAKELLQGSGAAPNQTEIKNLAMSLKQQEDELLYTDLISGSNTNIMQNNLIFLIEQLKPANKKQGDLAKALGVKLEAISRWKNGKQKPPKERLEKLLEFFGLPRNYDLENEPLFLSLDPIGIIEQRNWLHQKIDSLHDNTLQELFPAFKRLLEDP